MKGKIIGIIPARLNSTRLPRKLLLPIFGKTLLQRTYENAKRSQAIDELFVATYEDEIEDHVKQFGGKIIRTRACCLNGTDCVSAALESMQELKEAKIIINIQGDEPCLSLESIEAVIQILMQSPTAKMATAATKLETEEEARLSSIVKCTMDQQGNALYFSRQLIPGSKSKKFDPQVNYYRHLGIYAFLPDFLSTFSQLTPTPLQLEEDLEQLKVLEHGYQIKIAKVSSPHIGVDVAEDIFKVEKWLCEQNISS